MKLTFLGTRANIDSTSKKHNMHSSLFVSYGGHSVMIDCGLDWLGRLHDIQPDNILITHAHPDHAFGLQEGAPCPVYATQESWTKLENCPVNEREMVQPREKVDFQGLSFEAYPVEHSTIAPAVGYRIEAGRASIFYVPDVVWIRDRAGALSGVDMYVGDGATIERSLVRKMEEALVGHTPIRTQLTWCQKEGVKKAIFTHCGTRIVSSDLKKIEPLVKKYGNERKVDAKLAYDGLEITLP